MVHTMLCCGWVGNIMNDTLSSRMLSKLKDMFKIVKHEPSRLLVKTEVDLETAYNLDDHIINHHETPLIMGSIDPYFYLGDTMHTVNLVREFHTAFGHTVNDTPTIPDVSQRLLRVKLIAEELREFAAASGFDMAITLFNPTTSRDGTGSTSNGLPDHIGIDDATVNYEWPTLVNMVEAADALADLDYVVQGSNLVWGFPAEKIINEVHSSNMSKLGDDGKPIYRDDGKIMKGSNYRPPNIKTIIDKCLSHDVVIMV
jgi:predicted HAD superfamily Cof-like phosphohydrolase